MRFETANGARTVRKRVVAGEAMVHPVAPIEVTYEGRRERLLPRRDRFAPDHPLVRAQPEAFEPAWSEDTGTTKELVRMMDRRIKSLVCTPRRPLLIDIGDGRREWIHPRTSRLALDHDAVRARPADFRACDVKDTHTAGELRSLAGRSARQPLDVPSRRQPWRLDSGTGKGARWRL